ncbi:hypothetical protein SO802_007453 [Lithocarpus litseifolius]|uniref:Uncharacterized protein n=1 Tax=Lithocarpus litseifolius TaxID=425828 RepID=A0AAW2DNN8_9ROSI
MGDLSQTTNDNNEETKEETKQEQDSKLEFSEDEVSLIAKMFRLVGERWSLIAGRIPGRTAEEIEKYWTTKHSASSER